MCCVILNPPIEVRAGSKILAKVVLEKDESEFHVKVETVGKQHIFLHSRDLPNGKSDIMLALDRESLGDRESVEIKKFCIAAVGPGASQKITVESAKISSPKRK